MTQTDNLRIGTCGFRTSKDVYAQRLSSVEIQQTFYSPPLVSTVERWRSAMPPEFEFTLKAWQLITHESSSPTYRRLKIPITDKELQSAGSFRWSGVVRNAWDTIRATANALRARTVLFQCPAKFTPTPTNIRRLRKFFSSVERDSLNFAWEPRGEAWSDAIIASLCADLDLWHVVDPFARLTVTPDKCYFRMHGRVRWRYTYEASELEELSTLIPSNKLAYVFFNNVSMMEDAQLFQRITRNNEIV